MADNNTSLMYCKIAVCYKLVVHSVDMYAGKLVM